MGDLLTRKSVIQNTLTTTSQALFDQLSQMQSNQASYTNQNQGLQLTLTQLRGELTKIQQEADGYDREFLDRKAAGEGAFTGGRRFGLSTLQDWVLAFFFGSYVFATLVLAINAFRYAPKRGTGVGIVLVVSFIIGIMVAAMLIQMG